MKYLIAGLGNFEPKYHNTRHNIGFMVLDAFAEASNISFQDKRYGMICEYHYKSRTFILLKPSTYVNRSGLAVSYWLKKAKLSPENLLVIVDDIALPFGSIRIRPKGGDGGHNGLANISYVLGTRNYARLRFGIGDDFHSGEKVNYVLSEWLPEEIKELPDKFKICTEIVKSYGTLGLELTMTKFNKK
ncbi:MAG: aminoacyl-tRNA hydrolase [Bacteroidales bacterium]|nr:aminoacyl-tRNA hydrolase [Bacteroidales bacterium]